MRASVREAFVSFSAPLEGVVPFMYLDAAGLVTTAIGILIDPLTLALPLPFRRPDGVLASVEEKAREWRTVKDKQEWRLRGGMVYRAITSLRLDPEGISAIVLAKLDLHDELLRRRFSAFADWPADAQLATHSMAWACGAAFAFPRLEAALRARAFDQAALECAIDTRGPDREAGTADDWRGIVPRNVANRTLYQNAAIVQARGWDPDVLYYGRDLAARVDPTAPTERELPSVVDPDEEPEPTTIIRPDLREALDAALEERRRRDGEG